MNTLHMIPYTEGEFFKELDALGDRKDMKAIYIDQARFNVLRHEDAMLLVAVQPEAPPSDLGEFWRADGIPLFPINKKNVRMLDVDLKDGTTTLSTEYRN
jgi:hypothetical protein